MKELRAKETPELAPHSNNRVLCFIVLSQMEKSRAK